MLKISWLMNEQRQADVNTLLLLLGLLCHLLPLLFRFAGTSAALAAVSTLQLSRASSIVMLIAYIAYIFFQLVTHRQLFEAPDVSILYLFFFLNSHELIRIIKWIFLKVIMKKKNKTLELLFIRLVELSWCN